MRDCSSDKVPVPQCASLNTYLCEHMSLHKHFFLYQNKKFSFRLKVKQKCFLGSDLSFWAPPSASADRGKP